MKGLFHLRQRHCRLSNRLHSRFESNGLKSCFIKAVDKVIEQPSQQLHVEVVTASTFLHPKTITLFDQPTLCLYAQKLVSRVLSSLLEVVDPTSLALPPGRRLQPAVIITLFRVVLAAVSIAHSIAPSRAQAPLLDPALASAASILLRAALLAAESWPALEIQAARLLIVDVPHLLVSASDVNFPLSTPIPDAFCRSLLLGIPSGSGVVEVAGGCFSLSSAPLPRALSRSLTELLCDYVVASLRDAQRLCREGERDAAREREWASPSVAVDAAGEADGGYSGGGYEGDVGNVDGGWGGAAEGGMRMPGAGRDPWAAIVRSVGVLRHTVSRGGCISQAQVMRLVDALDCAAVAWVSSSQLRLGSVTPPSDPTAPSTSSDTSATSTPPASHLDLQCLLEGDGRTLLRVVGEVMGVVAESGLQGVITDVCDSSSMLWMGGVLQWVSGGCGSHVGGGEAAVGGRGEGRPTAVPLSSEAVAAVAEVGAGAAWWCAIGDRGPTEAVGGASEGANDADGGSADESTGTASVSANAPVSASASRCLLFGVVNAVALIIGQHATALGVGLHAIPWASGNDVSAGGECARTRGLAGGEAHAIANDSGEVEDGSQRSFPSDDNASHTPTTTLAAAFEVEVAVGEAVAGAVARFGVATATARRLGRLPPLPPGVLAGERSEHKHYLRGSHSQSHAPSRCQGARHLNRPAGGVEADREGAGEGGGDLDGLSASHLTTQVVGWRAVVACVAAAVAARGSAPAPSSCAVVIAGGGEVCVLRCGTVGWGVSVSHHACQRAMFVYDDVRYWTTGVAVGGADGRGAGSSGGADGAGDQHSAGVRGRGGGAGHLFVSAVVGNLSRLRAAALLHARCAIVDTYPLGAKVARSMTGESTAGAACATGADVLRDVIEVAVNTHSEMRDRVGLHSRSDREKGGGVLVASYRSGGGRSGAVGRALAEDSEFSSTHAGVGDNSDATRERTGGRQSVEGGETADADDPPVQLLPSSLSTLPDRTTAEAFPLPAIIVRGPPFANHRSASATPLWWQELKRLLSQDTRAFPQSVAMVPQRVITEAQQREATHARKRAHLSAVVMETVAEGAMSRKRQASSDAALVAGLGSGGEEDEGAGGEVGGGAGGGAGIVDQLLSFSSPFVDGSVMGARGGREGGGGGDRGSKGGDDEGGRDGDAERGADVGVSDDVGKGSARDLSEASTPTPQKRTKYVIGHAPTTTRPAQFVGVAVFPYRSDLLRALSALPDQLHLGGHSVEISSASESVVSAAVAHQLKIPRAWSASTSTTAKGRSEGGGGPRVAATGAVGATRSPRREDTNSQSASRGGGGSGARSDHRSRSRDTPPGHAGRGGGGAAGGAKVAPWTVQASSTASSFVALEAEGGGRGGDARPTPPAAPQRSAEHSTPVRSPSTPARPVVPSAERLAERRESSRPSRPRGPYAR